MQNPVALGAKRSADTVKGGIARAPGLPECGIGKQGPCEAQRQEEKWIISIKAVWRAKERGL